MIYLPIPLATLTALYAFKLAVREWRYNIKLDRMGL